ncbi:hypothetical protein J8273_7432 [Carpediemonas membranifera]|uniref:DNA-directed RNA polymerase II subunit RPB9-like zinc ribbon domain-containing protein n=1 Tax=Carpediemonas membranifera TaxID=201153 RepID=A0A8J6AXY7_9EUKA|nr:hypothetical protein J8273_7432 [Carpediemonas membranifera]|eukprot:KAG9391158.1 hypothetical protein J8273_7432 [Carpediemonas membranifera]
MPVLHFCSTCNNIMAPKETVTPTGARVLVYRCDACSVEMAAENAVVSRLVGSIAEEKDEKEDILRFDDLPYNILEDVTIPVQIHSCANPQCDSMECKLFQMEGETDQNMNVVRCCKSADASPRCECCEEANAQPVPFKYQVLLRLVSVGHQWLSRTRATTDIRPATGLGSLSHGFTDLR